MEFRILGPLEVEQEGRAVPVGRRKQRAVLAVLLLHVNRVVSVGQLIDAVWGDPAPETAHAILQGYVSALRKTLGPELIVTRSPGYLLRADPASTDLGRFHALVAAGKRALAAGEAEVASQCLEGALALWRGEPLADLDSISFVEAERARLEEIRLGALEERFEAQLALGRHADVIADLQALVRDEPLRERLRGQLMLALYRSGRQAEALDVYRQGRHLLANQLGLEPDEPLRQLQHAILEQDPALRRVKPPPVPRAAAGEVRPVVRPQPAAGRRRRRIAVAAGASVILLGAVVALAVVLARGGETPVAVLPNSVAVIDAQGNRVVAEVPVGRRPLAVASGNGGIRVCREGGTVSCIDPATRRVVRTIDIGTDCSDVAVGFGSVWVAGGEDGRVVRIDPALGQMTDVIPLAGRAGSGEPVLWVAAGARHVWATQGRRLLRIDPRTDRIGQPISIPPAAGLAAGPGLVWIVTAPSDNRLIALDASGAEQYAKVLDANAVSPSPWRTRSGSSSTWGLARCSVTVRRARVN